MPRALILLGAPGAGKGTVAGLLVARAGFVHLSTGDEIRREMATSASALGKQCRPFMDRGHFVPDAIALQIVEAFLARMPSGPPVIFDGFPRNVAQVPLMDELLRIRHLLCGGVFWIHEPEPVLVRRLAGRRLCPACGVLTHVNEVQPSGDIAQCPSCAHELIRRPDDQPDLIAERMRSYREQTGPMVDLYRKRGELHELPSGCSPPELVERILARMTA